MSPKTHDIPIPCQSCRLMEFWIIHNEASGQTVVRCSNCGAPFIQIEYAPQIAPDPAIIVWP